MPVSRQELARRLRVAREARGLTQEDVAEHLDVSRPTVAQMELGNRAVTSLELDRLARLYGRDLREFFMDDFQEHDALAALFRADSDVAQQSHVVDALRNCVTVGREVTNLEGFSESIAKVELLRSIRFLRRAPLAGGPARRARGRPGAATPRSRLRAYGNIAELLETQSIRAAWIDCLTMSPV